MKLLNEGTENEFYQLSSEEKLIISNKDFQWSHSINITYFKITEEDLIIRLHNGSMYLFEKAASWAKGKISTTLRDNIIARLIRKQFDYYFIGVENDIECIDKSDRELFYSKLSNDWIEKTRKKDNYQLLLYKKELEFFGPCDNSVLNFKFDVVVRSVNHKEIYAIGSILILEILKIKPESFMRVIGEVDSDFYSAYLYWRRTQPEWDFIFINPRKEVSQLDIKTQKKA